MDMFARRRQAKIAAGMTAARQRTLWKLLAQMRGWREAYDYDMNLLVVWHPVKSIHYTGADAWRLAALHK